jgi:tetratricopeptide (TPR) repeat protein
MRPLWKGLGTRPDTARLYPTVVAEVLLCAGILTRWIGSRNQSREAQTLAKDLITEAAILFESFGDVLKVASAHSELAYCYWREGAFGEARIWFETALGKLTAQGTIRANALLGLAVVEWSDSRLAESLRLLTANAMLFEAIGNHAIKGAYHTQLAIVLSELVTVNNKVDYLQRALREYQEADNYFKLARNIGYRARVKNNVGNILRQLSHFKEAHAYIAEARRLAVSLKDRVRVAQVDDTCALTLIDERRFTEAEIVARRSVSALDRTDHYCLLAESLITHGVALARLPSHSEQANLTLQRAMEIANQVGANNTAGLAALTLIEELSDQLSPESLFEAYDRASNWLSDLQNHEVQVRLNLAARKVLAEKLEPSKARPATPLFKPCNLYAEMAKFEGSLIRRALVAVNGKVTRAAKLLSITHQALAVMIERKHPELLTVRSPVRRRPRKTESSANRSRIVQTDFE